MSAPEPPALQSQLLPGELFFFLQKLTAVNGSELEDVLRQVVIRGLYPTELVNAIEKVVDRAPRLPSELLLGLIMGSKSAGLYARVRDWLHADALTLIRLLRLGFKDPAIEDKLGEYAYSIRLRDTDFRRADIVSALMDCGSMKSLRYLEAMLFELEPRLQVRKLSSQGLGPDDLLKPGLAKQVAHDMQVRELNNFVPLLRKAIAAIKVRGDAALPSAVEISYESGVELSNASTATVLNSVSNYRDRAWKRYNEGSMEEALSAARFALEAICKEIYRRDGLVRPGENVDDKMLNDLVKTMRKSPRLKLATALVESLKPLANFGSHEQGADTQKPTSAIVEPQLRTLEQLIEWFRQYLSANA